MPLKIDPIKFTENPEQPYKLEESWYIMFLKDTFQKPPILWFF